MIPFVIRESKACGRQCVGLFTGVGISIFAGSRSIECGHATSL